MGRPGSLSVRRCGMRMWALDDREDGLVLAVSVVSPNLPARWSLWRAIASDSAEVGRLSRKAARILLREAQRRRP